MPDSVQNLFAIDFSHYGTRGSKYGLVNHPSVRTTNFGLHSIRYHSIKTWNDLQDTLPFNIFERSTFGLKSELKELLIKAY